MATEPISLPKLAPVLHETLGVKEKDQLMEVQPEGTSHLIEDTATEGRFEDPLEELL